MSAWRRDTSLPGTTTSQPASRRNTSELPAIVYSRPSVRHTTRPPVLPVGLPAPPPPPPPPPGAPALASASGTFIPGRYCLLPPRPPSTHVFSRPPRRTLAPVNTVSRPPPSP